MVSIKDKAKRFDTLLSNLLALPIIAFCSCIMEGMLSNLAAIIGATDGYPPNPTITCGYLIILKKLFLKEKLIIDILILI